MKSHLTVILFMITDKYTRMKQPILNRACMENIKATEAFNLHMQNENESSNIKDKNAEYMYNLG